MMPPDEVAIETPEQIELTLEPAGLGSRFVAWVLDQLVKGLILLVLLVVGLILLGLLGASIEQWFQGYSLGVLVLGVAAVVLGYDVYFEVRHNGQTPGKKNQGLRVMREGGSPVDFRSACLRSLLALADFLPSFYLLGGTLVLLTRKRQRLGDMAAGTLVIRERMAQVPTQSEEVIGELASETFVFTAEQLQACTAEDRGVLHAFFQRYDEMKRDARDSLANRLTQLFLSKTGYRPVEPITTGLDAEQFLASLHQSLENWTRQGR